ncbi:MAG: T9SS type A sorting domain-containing protein [Tannerella sp.]|nr:T9SS type A sorting domain-containing protein [Tannerella sp.]
MKRIFLSGLLLCIAAVYVDGQDDICWYNKNEKMCFEMSVTKMIICSNILDETDISNALQNTVAGSIENIEEGIVGTYLVTMANTSKENMLELQREWNAREDVIYATPVFGIYGEALTNRLYIWLKSNNDYPVLQEKAEIYHLTIEQSGGLEYLATLPHNSDKNAAEISCELYETGLFQYASPSIYYTDAFGDKNGNEPVSSIQTISIYPNPVNDILYVDLGDETAGSYDIRLYNSLSNLCRQAKSANEKVLEFNVSNLSGGIYFLIISNGDAAKSETHKIIVKH